ncbi:Eco57I restriction-modification methylase domain-containing protein [Cucumibacter marinus]|uniref:Eco57I restriction-modification methylase domain-containing protein n=1 Tax=Cucumibacter marinus TaxID=1121252 RepID=UPI000426B2F9|nr:N-6 DNA methylase [Cucumibacter marinus]
MARKPISDMSAWPSLSLEGNLIAPAMIARIDQRDAPEQAPEDYAVRKGLTIREEISTAFRVGQSHFDAFEKLEASSQDATGRFVAGFFKETFGFEDLTPADAPLAMIASGRVPLVVVPPSETLDRRSPTLSVDRSRSPAFALQDYLNDSEEALWGIVTNGTHLRLMRDNASLTRPAFIEADLAQIFSTEDIASFAALWLLIHRSRFGAADTPATDCPLERWREAGSREGEAARDRLADQVQIALKVLGSGFLEANPELTAKMKSGEVNLTTWFNELLRLVYRLIFLMVAEDRNLLHPAKSQAEARALYAEGYSLAALRKQCYRAATWDKHHDRYEGIKIVFRALAHGQEALALPALGGLFAEDRLPHLETARLRNRAFMEALYRLSWLADKTGMVPVNWRAMETEELGSVYESLLELQPQLGADGKTLVFASEAAEQKGNQRKTTGSYYTPDSLVQALLDTALDPVLDKTEAEADDPATALLKLSVIDPACGSGHFLLAAARRIATRLARIRAEGTPSLADFRHALRDVARSCLHGVDRNPMAVELTKVALWIETVDPGLPLGFFDAQIRCGDALLGVFDLKVLEDGIPDAAYKPLTGDDKNVARHYVQKNKRERQERDRIAQGFGFNRARDLTREFAELRAMPEDTMEQIEAKAGKLRELTAQGAGAWQLEAACDLYVAAFLLARTRGGQFAGPDGLPRRGAEMAPTSGTLWEWLRGVQPFGPLFGAAVDAARTAHAFHWPLEFPDVMGRGGFDVVLGNPPWERIKLQEKEFFAARDADIASAPNAAARTRTINELRDAEEGTPQRALWDAFQAEKRFSDAISTFARVDGQDGGRFPFTGAGDVNTYQVFAELFSYLAGPEGRAGVIVPTGIATDATTAPFFSHLVEEKRLSSLVDFENRAGLFPAVDSRMKFCLLTIGSNEPAARFAFFLSEPAQLAEAERNFTLSPEQIADINPNTKTAPVFRSRWDAELTAKIYTRAPVLIEDSKGPTGNPWNVSLHSRIWHMAEDSEWFSTAANLSDAGYVKDGTSWVAEGVRPRQGALSVEGSGAGVLNLDDAGPRGPQRFAPLYEAKMFHHFDHRWATYDKDGSARDVLLSEKRKASFEPTARYWVPETEVTKRLRDRNWTRDWLMGWRDITNATNERTTIAAVFPESAVGHTSPLIFLDLEPDAIAGFLACLCSLALDFVARQSVGGTHLTFGYLKQLPILPPEFYTAARRGFITPRVLELTYTSHSLAPFARDLGHDGPPFAWDEDRRALLRAELDAFYARAYSLTRDELRYILDPADVKGPDYPTETFRVLKEKEIRQHGEYRTRRLVLSAWDRMEADGTFDALGLGSEVETQGETPRIELPVLARLRDGAWGWLAQIQPQDRLRYAAQYALWISDPAQDGSRIRMLVACLAEPALLTPLLSDEDRAHWIRLVGAEARPAQGVTRLRPPINAAWRTAFETLISSGQLEERDDGDWIRGRHFDPAGLRAESANAQRAAFALQAIRRLGQDRITAAVAQEDNIVWARFGHGTG